MEANYAELEIYLKALAQANRLQLIEALRVPRTLDEIRLTPTSAVEMGGPDRAMSRQGVQNHLDKLIDIGVVRVGATDRKGKRGILEFRLDSGRLFALLEELRRLTREPAVEPDPLTTQPLDAASSGEWPSGPKLVLVHGVREGRAFPLLHRDLRAPRGWIIGRAPGLPIHLDYDPYVSLENAEVIQRGSEFRLLDLRTARNGTMLNWRRLPPGGEAPLETGDVVGVGRSLLVFRPR